MKISRFICVILALLTAASGSCSASMLEFMNRGYAAEKIARRAGFAKEYIKTKDFTLMTYQRFNSPGEKIRIYIEGDGRAWNSRNRLSDDPTPSNPIALQLAAADHSGNVAYIARPGQFPDGNPTACDGVYWSGRRFAPEVVDSFMEAVDILKKKSGARALELTGYSGGGAIAVLIAARRDDVAALRTIAGNLDHAAVNRYHNVSSLKGSLNPIDHAETVSKIPQRHFSGSKDRTVPPFIADLFTERAGDASHARVTKVEGASHDAGWVDKWPELLSVPVQ
ncbi:MAG: alpha/beta hydrolase [Candidatus Omnitrophota bacterium]